MMFDDYAPNDLGAELPFDLGDADMTPWPTAFDHSTLTSILLAQYRSSAVLKGLCSAVLSSSQDVEDSAIAIYTQRMPDAAVGAQVDVLGAIANVPRNGMSDARYLVVQAAWNVARSSCATFADIYAALEALSAGGSFEIDDLPYDPAAIKIYWRSPAILPSGPDDISSDLLVALIRAARAAGVRVWVDYRTQDNAHTFTLASAYGVTSSTQGLADAYTSPTVGGHLAGGEIA